MTRAHRAFAFAIKSINETDGTFTGLASVYGVKDLQGDVVMPGAFTKSIKARGTEVPILWQHDQEQPIGVGTITDSKDGLEIKGRLVLDVAKAAEAYALLKAAVIRGLSIGYDVVERKFKDGARQLQELTLYEVSVVTFPANEDALVDGVKRTSAIEPEALGKLGLSVAATAAVRGFLVKAASYQDLTSAAYDALRDKFPFGNAWLCDCFEDHVIACTGDRYFQLSAEWDADGECTLGDPMEVERAYVPLGSDGKQLGKALGIKAGRTLSAANSDKLQKASDHLKKAADHVDSVIASGTPKADDDADADSKSLGESLRSLTKSLQGAIARP